MNHCCNSSLSGLFITSCSVVINNINNIHLRSITTTIEWLLCNLREIVIVALKALLRSWRNGVDRKTEFLWKFLPGSAVVEERADDACGKLAGAGCVRSLPDFAAVSASTEEVSHPDQICDEVSLFVIVSDFFGFVFCSLVLIFLLLTLTVFIRRFFRPLCLINKQF